MFISKSLKNKYVFLTIFPFEGLLKITSYYVNFVYFLSMIGQ